MHEIHALSTHLHTCQRRGYVSRLMNAMSVCLLLNTCLALQRGGRVPRVLHMHVYIYGLVHGLCLESIFIAMAVKRSDREELEKVFRKVCVIFTSKHPHIHYIQYVKLFLFFQYATVHKDDTWYITNKDFVCRYLQLVDTDTSSETIKLLAEVADTTKDGYVHYNRRK